MKKLLLSAIVSLVFCNVPVLFAQSVTQVSPGVAGEKDARGRNPELHVTRVQNGETVSLQVDAHVPHSDYRQYPMQFDFYINRQFFTSQIRSQELPGPVGIDIGTDVAEPPFNYAVVAKVMHPTRSTHSMVVGAVYDRETSVTLQCEVQYLSETYTATNVNTTQTANEQFSIAFAAMNSMEEAIDVVGVVNLSGTNASSLVEITADDVPTSYTTEGTVTLENNTLSAFTLSDSSGLLTVTCS